MQPERFPRMMLVQQPFPVGPRLDLASVLEAEFKKINGQIRPGARVAVGVGSRGIDQLETVVRLVLHELKRRGAIPFVVPAMGSHGGATAEGQLALLAEYGITQERLGVPILSSLCTRQIAQTPEGVPVHFSEEALQADAILPINRIKPHTDFAGGVGSGLQKMLVVGFGKRDGAVAFHAAASRLGYEATLRRLASVVRRTVPLLGGLALIENQAHTLSHLEFVLPDSIEEREPTLCEVARDSMPRLPFDQIDLLVVDRIGKNISGTGMDPAVTGRSVHGYSLAPDEVGTTRPRVRRLFVRDLTPESHGNAVGIGLADFTTSRVVSAMDRRVTQLNCLTALSLQAAKVPIFFDTDREAIEHALISLALPAETPPCVVRIRDTLSLASFQVSEWAFDRAAQDQLALIPVGVPEPMAFDSAGNLTPLSLGNSH